MYKMKEVCQMTGLTDRAIRLYVEQELVKPEIRDGIHNKAIFFSEADVERLKDIAALRNADFSIADIKLMIQNPENISSIVGEKEALLAVEIKRMKDVQDTLAHLSIQEHNDVTKLADAIEPRSVYAKETPKRKARWKTVLVWVVIITVLVLPFALQLKELFVKVMLLSIGIFGGIAFSIMAIGYFLYCGKYKKIQNRAIGKVVAIVSNEGIEEYIGPSRFEDFRQLLTMGVLRWNDIRPDHWFPLVQFEMPDKKIVTSTFRYGGLKSFWNVGDELEVAWVDERTIFPCETKWLKKKAWMHLLLGIVMIVIAWVILRYFR